MRVHAGELRHRALSLVRGADTFDGFKAAGLYYGFGDEWMRVGGVKYGADGSASERTMRMSTPYVGTNDYGILTMTQQEIDDAVEDAHRHNFRVAIHANGDVTIDMVLKAYERVLKQVAAPRPAPPHRALLAGQSRSAPPHQGARCHPDAVLDLRSLSRREVEGVRRREDALDVRAQVVPRRRHPRAGRVGLRAGPFEPLMAIQSMVTRKDFSGNVWGPQPEGHRRRGADDRHHQRRLRVARGAREGHRSRPGKFADFVMLEKDPHDVDPDEIKDIKIVRTVVGGKTVYEA